MFAIYADTRVVLLQMTQMRCWLLLANVSCLGFAQCKSCAKKLHKLVYN